VLHGTHLQVKAKTVVQPSDPTQYRAVPPATDGVQEEELTESRYGDEHEIYAEIASALSGQARFSVTPESVLELTRVLDAIRTSSDENRVVTL
jgi:hypothetical protein